jgi:hypothetical protein
LHPVKPALILVVASIALVAAGCGGPGTSSSSDSTTTTAAPAKQQSAYLQSFQAVNNRYQESPQIGDLSQALETASTGPESLAAAEAPLHAYLGRLDTYIAELRGLHFPACARHFQVQIVKFESEGRAAVARILPLLEAGDPARVAAYVKRTAPVISSKLGQVEEKENALEGAGNGGC